MRARRLATKRRSAWRPSPHLDPAVANAGGTVAALAVVDLDAVKEKGLIPKKSTRLKILAKGEIDRALTVKAHKFSAKASEAIEAAGGTVETTP